MRVDHTGYRWRGIDRECQRAYFTLVENVQACVVSGKKQRVTHIRCYRHDLRTGQPHGLIKPGKLSTRKTEYTLPVRCHPYIALGIGKHIEEAVVAKSIMLVAYLYGIACDLHNAAAGTQP